MRKSCLLLIFLCSLLTGFSQTRIITGEITSSEDKLPVIGASILVQGTGKGTVTDFEGKFSVGVPENAVLVFSYVGMLPQKVKVGKSDKLNIVLKPDTKQLNEVVVLAMGVKSEKKKANFAVQSLNSDDLTIGKSINFVNSLQGKVAGVSVSSSGGSPTAGSQIIIRGISSINGSQGNEPLFVIDGMTVSGGASKAADINPNDIENVTVLKGAAASALYGQEAANGVIMITTKSAKAGTMTVTANAGIQIDNAMHIPQIQSKYGPGAQGFYKEQTSGGWGPLIQPGEKIYDNVGKFLGTGIVQKYDVSATGGTDRFTSYSSVSYMKNDGMVPNNYLNRIGMLVKGSYKVSKTLEVSMMANIVNNQSRGAGALMSSIYSWPINDDMSYYKKEDGSIRWRYIADKKQDSPLNPYWSRYEDSGTTESTRNLMQAAANWKPFNNFELVGRLNYDQTNSHSDSYTTPRWSKSDFTANELPSVDKFYFGSYGYSQSKSRLFTAQALATYKVKVTDDFELNLLAGTELKTRNSLESDLGGRDFLIPGDFYSMSNIGEVINGKDVSLYHIKRRSYGFYGEARFDYRGMAHISVTGRNDHSSTLTKGENSYFYPSVTGGVIFSELFGIANDIFSYGKLRGNWAKVGKDANPYLFDRKYKQFPTFPDKGFGADPTSSVAKYLKPEMTNSWEIGTELRFFNNKTVLDLAYYSTMVDNQIVNVRVSPASGNILETRNEGSVENYGIEASLNQEILKSKLFNWNVAFNFGLNRGRVRSLPDGIVEIQGTQYGDIFPTAYLNGSTTAISGKDYLRSPKGKVICTADGYPMINPAKGNLIGNREPDFRIGFTNSISYKDLSLSFLLDARVGGDVVNVTGRSLFSNGMNKSLETYRNRLVMVDGVVKQPDGSYVPNTKPILMDQTTLANYFEAVSSNFIEDGSYLRLSYVTLSYELSKYLRKSPFKALKLSVTGQNLFLLTKYTGNDPQINASPTSGGTGGMGIDNFDVPNARSFNFTLNATF